MRAFILSVLLAGAVGAVYVSQHARHQPGASPAPLVGMLADTQRAVARVPSGIVRPDEGAEVAMGRELLAWRRTNDTTARAQYVARVGASVAAGAHRRLPYSFHLVEDDAFVNAYALPGGPVFIGAGLLALMQSEDELAAVLAHEVEHIDHYHCIDRYAHARAAGRVPVVGPLVELPVWLFERGYEKNQELEADADGTRLAARAGYAPLAITRLLAELDRCRLLAGTRRPASPIEEVITIPLDAVSAYFESHPPGTERIARIEDVVRSDRLDRARPTQRLNLPARAYGPEAP